MLKMRIRGGARNEEEINEFLKLYNEDNYEKSQNVKKTILFGLLNNQDYKYLLADVINHNNTNISLNNDLRNILTNINDDFFNAILEMIKKDGGNTKTKKTIKKY